MTTTAWEQVCRERLAAAISDPALPRAYVHACRRILRLTSDDALALAAIAPDRVERDDRPSENRYRRLMRTAPPSGTSLDVADYMAHSLAEIVIGQTLGEASDAARLARRVVDRALDCLTSIEVDPASRKLLVTPFARALGIRL